MSQTRNTGYLTNIVQYTPNGSINFVSGSTTLMSISSSGAITTTGVISGSNALSSSYSLASTTAYTASSVSNLNQNVVVTGSLTTTGQIVAQTLNVQQVTSSIVYSSGSNIFGNSLGNTQQMTGSLQVTSSNASYFLGGNVGVGTTSPSSTVHAIGVIRSSNAGNTVSTRIESDGLYTAGSDMFIDGGTSNIRFYSTSERMRITSAGNVGIGETVPNSKLDIVGSSNNPSTYGTLTIRNSSSTGISIGALSTSYAWIQGNVYGSGTTPLLLNPQGGNVLIGTTNTANGHKLEIIAGSQSALRIDVTSGYSGIAMSPGAIFGIDKPGVGGGTFKINSNGNVFINTTTDLPYDTAVLAVKENGGIAAGFKGGTGVWAVKVGTVDTGGTRYMIGFCNDAAATIGGITTNGSNTSYNTSSDRRLKENIKPIENAIDKILKLKPVTYDWIGTGISDDGFIAQDLLELDEFKHRVNSMGKGEDGSEYYGVDYMKFVSILTKAIQELKAENDSLKEILQRNNIQ